MQGFWDLVSIQVDDMKQKFRNLEELECNGWKQQQAQPTRNKKRGKVGIYIGHTETLVLPFTLVSKTLLQNRLDNMCLLVMCSIAEKVRFLPIIVHL